MNLVASYWLLTLDCYVVCSQFDRGGDEYDRDESGLHGRACILPSCVDQYSNLRNFHVKKLVFDASESYLARGVLFVRKTRSTKFLLTSLP